MENDISDLRSGRDMIGDFGMVYDGEEYLLKYEDGVIRHFKGGSSSLHTHCFIDEDGYYHEVTQEPFRDVIEHTVNDIGQYTLENGDIESAFYEPIYSKWEDHQCEYKLSDLKKMANWLKQPVTLPCIWKYPIWCYPDSYKIHSNHYS